MKARKYQILTVSTTTTYLSILPFPFFPSFLSEMSSTVIDDTFANMLAEGQSWGDFVYDNGGFDVAEPPLVPNPDPWAVDARDVLKDYEVPDLTLRKGIWTHFPVVLKQLNDGDGTDRYSVEWHSDNLWASFVANARSDVDFVEWKEWVSIRLFHSLGLYGRKYTVEEARAEGQVCVLAMVHLPRAEEAPVVVATTLSAPGRRRALDVLKTAPISWERDGAKHSVKIHNKKCRELGLSEAAVKADLLNSLKQCPDCVVSSAPGFICVVTML